MDAALGLSLPGQRPDAGVLARRDPPGARLAADRAGSPASISGLHRQRRARPDVARRRPRRSSAAIGLTLTLPCVASQPTTGVLARDGASTAAQPADPRVVPARGPRPAGRPCAGSSTGRGRARAAAARTRRPARPTLCRGVTLTTRDRQQPRDAVAGLQRLGEVVAGVEEEHVDAGQRRPTRCDDRRVLHRRGDGEAVAEHRGRPARRSPRRARLELAPGALGERLQVDVDGGEAGHVNSGGAQASTGQRRGGRRPARCRSTGRRRPGGRRRTATRRGCPRAAGGPPRRSRGSAAPRSALAHPSASSSARATQVANRSPASRPSTNRRTTRSTYVGQLVGGDLEAADLAAEAGVQRRCRRRGAPGSPRPARRRAVHDLALEPDVGGLDAGAGVGATVDVQRDRYVDLVDDVGQPGLQLGHRRRGQALGLDDRQLAELDPGAGHRAAPERRSAGADSPISSSAAIERLDLGLGRRRGRAASGAAVVRTRSRAVRLDDVGDRGQLGRRRPGRRSGRRRRRSGRPSARARRRRRPASAGSSGAGRRRARAPRYSFSSTSRNFSTPQSATRNFSRARCRSRR